MTAKRRKLQRQAHPQITPEVLWAFQQIRKLETQCTCRAVKRIPVLQECSPSYKEECPACKAWWHQQTIIHRALKLPPVRWPCLPDPASDGASEDAIALYEQLEAAVAS
jgi:hypothetical protein